MVQISTRKVRSRLPVLLVVDEVKILIDAATTPFERAVVEVLHATGVRVSEFVSLREEDILWHGDGGSIRVKNGKGGKERVVFFGKHAAEAIREYVQWRGPSQKGLNPGAGRLDLLRQRIVVRTALCEPRSTVLLNWKGERVSHR